MEFFQQALKSVLEEEESRTGELDYTDIMEFDKLDTSDQALTPRIFFFNLSSTITTAQAVAIVLGIGLAIAALFGLLFYTYYATGDSTGYGYGEDGYDKDYDSSEYESYKRSKSSHSYDDLEFISIINSLTDVNAQISRIKSPEEEKEFYKNLKTCVNKAMKKGNSIRRRIKLLQKCNTNVEHLK